MKPIFSLVIVATILLLIQWVGAQILSPKAPTVTAGQIQALQADSENSQQFLIVDVRDKVETDVSTIPGAITVAEFEQTQQDHQGKKIITYCTVGYRSGIYAQKLRAIGWNAWNYQGSILDWCNNQLPVVTPSGRDTNRVHTYNSRYALKAGYQPVF